MNKLTITPEKINKVSTFEKISSFNFSTRNILLIITLSVLFQACTDKNTKDKSNTGTNSIENKIPYSDLGGLKTWIKPKVQLFDLSSKTSHTLECKNGTLIIVPKNAFCDKNGKTITENVQLEVVEAINMADMIAYNLTTMSDGKALQSGGMMYIQPTLNKIKVFINPKKPLHIEIPTQSVNSEMVAWKGIVNDKGEINWSEPQELYKFLIPVDFSTLDFLPEKFASVVDAAMPYKKYKKSTPKLIDSLYYSLSEAQIDNGFTMKVNGVDVLSSKTPVNKRNEIEAKYSQAGEVINQQKISAKTVSKYTVIEENSTVQYDGLQEQESDVAEEKAEPIKNEIEKSELCYINPLTIKTIKTKPFSNTFLATKEFEQRLQLLHKIKNAQKLVELYIHNISKNLYEVDQLVANQLTGKDKNVFQKLADLKLRNVDNKSIHQEDLKAYYNSSRKKYQQEVDEAKEKYNSMTLGELAKLEAQTNELRYQYNVSSASITKSYNESNEKIAQKNIERETEKVNQIAAQLKQEIPAPSIAITPSYKVSWNSPGWMNIDCYLHLLGKDDVIVRINSKSFTSDNSVFQCINTLKTIIPLNLDQGHYEAHFPKLGNQGSEEMKDTYCVGMHRENEKVMYAEQRYNPYENKELNLKWTEVSEEEMEHKLKLLSPINDQYLEQIKQQREALLAEIEYRKKQEIIRKQIEFEYQQERERLKKEYENLKGKLDAKKEAINLKIALENAFKQKLIDAISLCTGN